MEPSSYLSHRQPGTHGTVLRDLHALNRTFLDLILTTAAVAPDMGLDECRVASLATLNDEQIARLARCPYALFDLSFGAAEPWHDALGRPADRRGTVCAAHALADISAFALAAVLFARQLGDGQADLARLLLGMDEEVGRLLREATLPQLSRCAFDGEPPLRARLARHPHFWADIVDFVRDGTRERQLAAHTCGVQHSAFRR